MAGDMNRLDTLQLTNKEVEVRILKDAGHSVAKIAEVTKTTRQGIYSVLKKIDVKEQIASTHYKHNLDVTRQDIYCSDCEIDL